MLSTTYIPRGAARQLVSLIILRKEEKDTRNSEKNIQKLGPKGMSLVSRLNSRDCGNESNPTNSTVSEQHAHSGPYILLWLF